MRPYRILALFVFPPPPSGTSHDIHYNLSQASENEARAALGQEPLEDDLSKTMKISPQPSRLDTFLLSNQLSNYCDQIQGACSLAFNKLYVTEALSSAKPTHNQE